MYVTHWNDSSKSKDVAVASTCLFGDTYEATIKEVHDSGERYTVDWTDGDGLDANEVELGAGCNRYLAQLGE